MTIRKVTDSIYISSPNEKLDRPVIGLLKGSKRTLFFDAGSSPGHVEELKATIPIYNINEPDFIIVSHSHTDHWFGLIEYNSIGICSQKCMDRIEEMACMDWRKASYEKAVAEGNGSGFLAGILDMEYGENRTEIKLKKPEIAFHKELKIDLGSLTAIVERIESNHSPDQSILYIPEEKVVFLGDCLYLRTKLRHDVDSLFEQIEKYNALYYIDSHNEDIMNLDEAKDYCLSYVNSL
jgi:glyoxylase-like metal-dependent hydrolase (beta-lactamase superfamily II)